MPSSPVSAIRLCVLAILSLFFAAAGVAHFTMIAEFAAIVPPGLPFPGAIVRITGVMELIFALGLLLPRWRARTGWALAGYLLCVLPANVYMALEGIPLADWAATKFAPMGPSRVAIAFNCINPVVGPFFGTETRSRELTRLGPVLRPAVFRALTITAHLRAEGS